MADGVAAQDLKAAEMARHRHLHARRHRHRCRHRQMLDLLQRR